MKLKKVVFKEFQLESGLTLKNVEVAYHTFGNLNAAKNNAVWICHALTANSNPYEWWPNVCGENGFFNEKEHFIVCANILGSCYGTTGPLSKDENDDTYYDYFPLITTRDMARLHEKLRLHLQLSEIYVLVGASLGGQQALEWSIENPSIFRHLILIATNAKHSPYGIAFNESQRLAIKADSTYGKKDENAGEAGLIAARSIALLSYRSYEGYSLSQKEDTDDVLSNYKASSYQKYQGIKLAKRFNAYSYVLLSHAMDSHNVGRSRNGIEKALAQVKAKTLIIGITTDILFPIEEQRKLWLHIPNSKLKTIESKYGHDGFLIEHESLVSHFKKFLTSEPKSYFKSSQLNELLFTA
jgi:homoserine O-acetyltransferase